MTDHASHVQTLPRALHAYLEPNTSQNPRFFVSPVSKANFRHLQEHALTALTIQLAVLTVRSFLHVLTVLCRNTMILKIKYANLAARE